MASTVSLDYTRKITNKLADGSFESFELGGSTELDLGSVESIDEVNAAYDQLYQQFVANVEAKVLEVQGSLQTTQPASEPQDESKDAKLTRWVKKTVDTETDRIRTPAVTGTVLPGERFKTPPPERVAAKRAEQSDEPVEGEAVSYEGLKVFLDNKQTKKGKTQNGKKFGMLRLGGKGQMPASTEGYATGKSFDPEVVEDIYAIIDEEIDRVDVFGYWEPRNNDPEVFDIVLQGVKPAGM